jgi:uncharacterized protein (TIGR00725 family)
MSAKPPQIAVIGAGEGTSYDELAERVGELLAGAGATVVCGGRSGVMAAACRGARRRGGVTVGILPGADAVSSPPNTDVQIAIYTGLGQARNQLVVLSADAVIAVGGGWGTLSEIALARKQGRAVILLGTQRIERPDGAAAADPGLHYVDRPEDAVRLALKMHRR